MDDKRKLQGRKRITKVLPDKIFFKLWTEAHKINDVDEYINTFLRISSKDRINFSKYEIDDFAARNMLENIYNAANITIREIIEKTGLRKSQISYQFCIPIRTIEDWCAGKNKCAPYIKLMLLRYFNMITLGSHIVLESEDNRKNKDREKGNKEKDSNKVSKEDVKYYKELNRRRMEYSRRVQETEENGLETKSEQTEITERTEYAQFTKGMNDSDTTAVIERSIEDIKEKRIIDEDDDLSKIDELLAEYDFTKYEKDHVHHGSSEAKNILETTDYLKDILK